MEVYKGDIPFSSIKHLWHKLLSWCIRFVTAYIFLEVNWWNSLRGQQVVAHYWNFTRPNLTARFKTIPQGNCEKRHEILTEMKVPIKLTDFTRTKEKTGWTVKVGDLYCPAHFQWRFAYFQASEGQKIFGSSLLLSCGGSLSKLTFL